jgi:hypothetical protein
MWRSPEENKEECDLRKNTKNGVMKKSGRTQQIA